VAVTRLPATAGPAGPGPIDSTTAGREVAAGKGSTTEAGAGTTTEAAEGAGTMTTEAGAVGGTTIAQEG